MTPELALENLRQLCSRPTTQINGLTEAQAIDTSLAILAALLDAMKADAPPQKKG